MATILDKIFADKKAELQGTQRKYPLADVKDRMQEQSPILDVRTALSRKAGEPSRIIAEIKRKTPFKGELRPDFDALRIAREYAENGAAAISMITEEKYFGGSIEYLSAARKAVNIPLLRKDFIFAEYQVYEARACGADMFLLIATYLDKNQLADLLECGREIGMTALVETHHEKDVDKAFGAKAFLLGINNRDLTSGKTDLGISRRLLKLTAFDPQNILVCESGINTRSEIEEFEKLGAHAFLIGESLMKSEDIPKKLKELVGNDKISG